MKTLKDAVALVMRKADTFDSIKATIGKAFTPQQQLDVSAHLAKSPTAFEDWLRTEAGNAAARAFADAFIEATPK